MMIDILIYLSLVAGTVLLFIIANWIAYWTVIFDIRIEERKRNKRLELLRAEARDSA